MSQVGKKRTPLGRFLVVERARRDWSQEDLAKAADIGVATVIRLETDEPPRRLQLGTLQDLARALGKETCDLVRMIESEDDAL